MIYFPHKLKFAGEQATDREIVAEIEKKTGLISQYYFHSHRTQGRLIHKRGGLTPPYPPLATNQTKIPYPKPLKHSKKFWVFSTPSWNPVLALDSTLHCMLNTLVSKLIFISYFHKYDDVNTPFINKKRIPLRR